MSRARKKSNADEVTLPEASELERLAAANEALRAELRTARHEAQIANTRARSAHEATLALQGELAVAYELLDAEGPAQPDVSEHDELARQLAQLKAAVHEAQNNLHKIQRRTETAESIARQAEEAAGLARSRLAEATAEGAEATAAVKQLRAEEHMAQKLIDGLNAELAALTAEVRQAQLKLEGLTHPIHTESCGCRVLVERCKPLSEEGKPECTQPGGFSAFPIVGL